MIQANIVVEGEPPVASLPDEATAAAIYNCCTPEQIGRAVARRRPQAVAVFATPVQADDERAGGDPALLRAHGAGQLASCPPSSGG